MFIIDGGVHIPKLESAKITYAGYFAPVADTSSPLIKMRLRCKCCTTAPGINFHNVTARGDASSFSNAAEHLLTCPSNPPLTVEDSLKRADKKKQPMVLAAAQEGARLIMDGEDHLKQLGMSKEMLWEGIVEMLVADAEPLGAVGRFGMRRLFTQLKLPLMGVTTSHRIFEKMTKELIKVPIEEQLRVWSLTPMGYNAGAHPHFQPSYRCSLPGGNVRLLDGKILDVPPGIFELGPLQLTQGNDGWTSGKETFESAVLKGWEVIVPVTRRRIPGKMEEMHEFGLAELRQPRIVHKRALVLVAPRNDGGAVIALLGNSANARFCKRGDALVEGAARGVDGLRLLFFVRHNGEQERHALVHGQLGVHPRVGRSGENERNESEDGEG